MVWQLLELSPDLRHWQGPWLMFPVSTLTAQMEAGSRCDSWPAASVSPTHTCPGPPGTQTKKEPQFNRTNGIGSSPRTGPNGREAAGNLSGLEGLVEWRVDITFHLDYMDGSMV